ncbi:class I SAM-dependent methyltransferase [Flavisolibacter nicotianae]|uniref:class I SAM-dependent methyltransferase n=1 Tax=Flavisolibacter nicotianae TaxID=2364882 RepID=UPI000EAEB893|nr:class I SAM-dependent methyltransferase [Flavisolibacter nicotianae]
MKSKITGGDTALLFTARVLEKYDVSYYRCKDTGFIQTEEPYWLNEAYSSAITKLDVGIVMRNENLIRIAQPLLSRYFDHNALFLDYAGGYGLFTRMMRDRGFRFYHTDPYCQNIFAEYQDLKELEEGTKFEVVTAFEVLEHLASPVTEIGNILSYSDNFFFSTELVPPNVNKDWWYFSFETGQHISFYTKEALHYIAKNFGREYYTDGRWLHLFTRKPLAENPFEALGLNRKEPFLIRKMRKFLRSYDNRKQFMLPKESLLDADVKEAQKRIR